ncbi:hypothetical protein BX264_5495 [Streptomyces sp. 2333.5]|uniref:DUF6507 family protein n=1 Tax=unclassified Streptomyces TaxID=2593676 RepID=UPI00089566B3|nr:MULTISPECIES: DUF6507 family protein [unclassified Streptomyces]PJJ05044.1 hypothetical protein BX264_5495 [Streptomyces sp. 2333.5]SEE66772.1 hypothetical protein SAMN05428943_5597 [Streptomyces sp. 2314.4]SEE93098.1 hypothetical protein SAMN05428942_5593 [Streptomyces sp. 2112.2]
MASWDIQPQGVQGQLKVVGTHAEDLGKALTTLLADMREAAEAAGTAVPGSQAKSVPGGLMASGHKPIGPVAPALLPQKATGPVGAALAQYATQRQTDFKAMADRCQAAVLGAAKATGEYVEGDLEAARHAQNAARAVRLDALKDAGGKK